MNSILRKKSFWVIILLISVVSIVGFKKGDDFKISKSLDIYYSLFRELNLFYVDETDPQQLVKTSIDEMLESLDPYTEYIPESDMEDFKFQTTGDYGGIGALVRKEGDYALISQPYKNSPADKAGIKTGDIIQKINGESIKGWELEKVSDNLKGVPESELTLTIKRPGQEETLEKNIIRKEVHINSVPYHGVIDKENKIGYIRITKFTKNSGKEVKEAYREMEKNHELNSIVLDLRNNPGGLLIEAVNVANIFIPEGKEIVSTKGRVEKWNEEYVAEKEAIDTEIPLVVMVNNASASASEIVAGAVQDYDRGVIVGRRTYGKGLVQTTRPLSYNSQLKVTTAKYHVPSGRSIQAKDYSNRKEDGSVGEIPDTLINEYTTKNGRKVYDGGGINPDIKQKSSSLSQLEISLISEQLIFDYATQFSLEKDTIPPVSEFEISEDIYQDFKNYIMEKDWEYNTKSEEKLDELIELAKKEKYYELAEENIEELKENLSPDKESDLETFKAPIKSLLEEEIVGRYYYQAGSIEARLEEDIQLDKAKEILLDTNLYNDILSGEYATDNVKEMQEKLDKN
ncbi:MAG: S41 family peptidase [Bacteroidales bacterium]